LPRLGAAEWQISVVSLSCLDREIRKPSKKCPKMLIAELLMRYGRVGGWRKKASLKKAAKAAKGRFATPAAPDAGRQ
jgi:hypothetical protein